MRERTPSQPPGDDLGDELGDAFVRCLSGAGPEAVPGNGDSGSLREVRLRKARDVIDTHYTDAELTVELVAARFRLSPAYLNRLLKVEYGCGFRAALKRKRLSEAGVLMRESLENVKEIARVTGWRSASALHREFKRGYGVSPEQYREGGIHLAATTHDKATPPRTATDDSGACLPRVPSRSTAPR